MPFYTTFAPQSIATTLWQCFLILMVYDFFYYLTHRFIFTGQGYFCRVHAVQHIDRHRGNYASITLLFDKLFGTYDSDAKTEASTRSAA